MLGTGCLLACFAGSFWGPLSLSPGASPGSLVPDVPGVPSRWVPLTLYKGGGGSGCDIALGVWGFCLFERCARGEALQVSTVSRDQIAPLALSRCSTPVLGRVQVLGQVNRHSRRYQR